MKRIKTIIESKHLKIAITIITSTVIVVFSARINFSKSWKSNLLNILIILFCYAINIIYISYMDNIQHQNIENYDKAINEMEAFKDMFDGLYHRLNEEAEGINKIANSILNEGKISTDRWTFDKESVYLCQEVFKFLKSIIGKESKIHVLYVKKLTDCNICTVGYANNANESPGNFRITRDIHDSNAYKDATLFRENSSHAFYRLKPDDVDKVLYYEDREKESGKYEQCLFIPVMCDRNKLVGMLEILSGKGTVIACDKDEMDKLIAKLEVFTALFLLLQKTDKAACAIPIEVNYENEIQ